MPAPELILEADVPIYFVRNGPNARIPLDAVNRVLGVDYFKYPKKRAFSTDKWDYNEFDYYRKRVLYRKLHLE